MSPSTRSRPPSTPRDAGADLEFVARGAAPVDVIGEAFARILDGAPDAFPNGSTIEVPDVVREWGSG